MTKLKLHNTLSRKIEEIVPIKKGHLSMYTCGPTVYDQVHIGNLTTYIYADTLNRVFESQGYQVKHVVNITDVDDKTIKKSRDEFPEDSPENALSQVTSRYERTFFEDSGAVGNRLDRYIFIKATESIDLMKDLISSLLTQKIAYISDDGIYFSIEAYKKSGKKYGQLINLPDQSNKYSRINNDEYSKDSIHDFALWKFNKEGEPTWSFEIEGIDYLGRPGWHIECSAMSVSLLGQPFDIHTGGIDLVFPHHENEIAQSTASEDNTLLATYFIHNEHLLVENRKMAKSENNFITLSSISEKNFDPLAFRLLVLQGHYQNQSEFNWELLAAAQTRLVALRNIAVLRWQYTKESSEKLDFTDVQKQIEQAINENLNIPKALSIISEFMKKIEASLVSSKQKEEFEQLIGYIDLILGLSLRSIPDISEDQKELLKQRQESRNKKNFEDSDQVREKLSDSGIGVKDTEFGQVWYLLH